MNALLIPHAIFDALLAQARAAAPLEACALLAGREGRVERCYPMTNADRSADHFTMDPAEQFAAAKAMRAAGLTLLAIHHSHPASPARPSAEDIRLALTPGAVYTIVSLQHPTAPALKGFTIENGVVTETPVQVES